MILIRQGIPNLLPMQNRSPGLHVSTIINDICVRNGQYVRDPEQDINAPEIMTRLQLGCALETAIRTRYMQQYPLRYIEPGELTLDGISGTPDLEDLEDLAIEEFKLTWLSADHALDPANSPKLWKFRVQLMAYCFMSRPVIYKGRLHVGFINGGERYTTPPTIDEYGTVLDEGGVIVTSRAPSYYVWETTYKHRELRDNWAMLKSHGERYQDEILSMGR